MLICCEVFGVVYEFDILYSWQDDFLDRERRWEERRSAYRMMSKRGFYRSGHSVDYNCSKFEYGRNLDNFDIVPVHGACAVLPLLFWYGG